MSINEQKERSRQLEGIIDTLNRYARDKKENHDSTKENLSEQIKIKDGEINKLKKTNTSEKQKRKETVKQRKRQKTNKQKSENINFQRY